MDFQQLFSLIFIFFIFIIQLINNQKGNSINKTNYNTQPSIRIYKIILIFQNNC
jgi:hypothetical protein